MVILARLIGAYLVAMGILFILRPKTLKDFISFWNRGNRLYIVGISRLLGGAILLLASPQCRLRIVAVILGILTFILGIMYFVPGIGRMKVALSRWEKRPARPVRMLGLFMLAIGALLLYSI